MTYRTTLRQYYRRIVRAGRRGDPTMDEARAGYSAAMDARSYCLFAAR